MRETRTAVQRWAAVNAPGPEAPRGCWLTRRDDDSGRLVADLSADDLALVDAALLNAVSFDAEQSVATMHADALITALGFYLDHHEHASTKRNRPHVNIVLDANGATWHAKKKRFGLGKGPIGFRPSSRCTGCLRER